MCHSEVLWSFSTNPPLVFLHLFVRFLFAHPSFTSPILHLLQVVPPGFHLVPLPFRDDIRTPECDPALVGRVTAAGGRSGPPRADQQQVGQGWLGGSRTLCDGRQRQAGR